MAPDKIRLIALKERTVDWHEVKGIPWDRVWAISHVWDRGREITIPLKGVSWRSTSFSSVHRFSAVFERTCQIIEPRGAEYVWMDAACIDQCGHGDKEEQVPFMGTIYSESAGSIAFGTLTSDDRFVQIVSTYNDDRNAWVCDWFERMWTFQELRLPKLQLFVSGDHVLTRDEVHLSILMMSPYLTSPHLPSPSCPNDPTLSIQDVLNSLSPSSFATQRSLMQTSKRSCSISYIHDKIYGVLGLLGQTFSNLKVDYNISLAQAMMNFMKLMPPNDVLDTLTFNTLPPAVNIHDALHWSGMMMLDQPTEHPSSETDNHHPTNAVVVVSGDPPRAYTIVYDAPLWKVVVTKQEDAHAKLAEVGQTWPSLASVSRYAKLTDNFSKVERSANYAGAITRAKKSLAASQTRLKPLLETAVGGGEFLYIFQDLPPKDKGSGIMPPNRLGDPNLFDQEVTVLVCRSKKNKPFNYGIVVTPNEDGSWHKVCTAAFSDTCVVATSRAQVENLVVIGK